MVSPHVEHGIERSPPALLGLQMHPDPLQFEVVESLVTWRSARTRTWRWWITGWSTRTRSWRWRIIGNRHGPYPRMTGCDRYEAEHRQSQGDREHETCEHFHWFSPRERTRMLVKPLPCLAMPCHARLGQVHLSTTSSHVWRPQERVIGHTTSVIAGGSRDGRARASSPGWRPRCRRYTPGG
jgi:hypothetical protein